ncbi:MAG: type VI secretion system protein IglI family protein [Candidatus Sedimenticola sp. (ex Thyasira tokunagai)]
MTAPVYQLIVESVQNAKPYNGVTIDEVLTDIDKSLNRGELGAVECSCFDLLSNHCSDIRVVSLYLYTSMLWLTKAGVVELFPILKLVHQQHIEQVLPDDCSASKKLMILDSNLAFLFKKLNRKIDYFARQQNIQLLDWYEQLDYEALEQVQSDAQDFIDFASGLLLTTEQNSIALMRRFKQTMSDIRLKAPQQPEEEPLPPAAVKELAVEPPALPVTASITAELMLEELSYPLELLIKKLGVFQVLLTQQNHIKTAVLMTDILQTLETFDPRVYFPQSFKPFVEAQVLYGDQLKETEMLAQEYSTQALKKMLHLDLDAFIDIKFEYSHEGEAPL